MMKERTPGFWGICGFSPDSTLGTEITKSRPKSRRALPEMLMTPVYSCTAGEPSIRYGEPIEAGCCAATSKKFVVPSTKVLSSCSYSMVGCFPRALAHELCDGLVQLPVGEGLVEEAVRALLHRLHRGRLVGQSRDHEDAHRGLHGHESRDALDAVHLRHGDVHGHDVRVGLLEELERLEPVAGGAHQLELLEPLRALDTPAHDVRVVDDHQLERALAAVVRYRFAVAHGIRPWILRRPRCSPPARPAARS